MPPCYLSDRKFTGHHPVFGLFPSVVTRQHFNFGIGYVGDRISHSFNPGFHGKASIEDENSKIDFTPNLPEVNEEYFEWIDLLMSIKDAKNKYVFIELGAGFGRWGVRAALAVNTYRPHISSKIIFVEGEPKHISLLKSHLENNKLLPEAYSIIEAAVSNSDGETLFYVNMPDEQKSCEIEWWGQSIAKGYEKRSLDTGHELYYGEPVIPLQSGYGAIKVKKIDIRKLLEPYAIVDLIDMDIQGEELNVVSHSIRLLNKRVKRLHIGTHSVEVEVGLRKILGNNNWICIRDYACQKINPTPFGEINFLDGVQTWINPRFEVTFG